MKKTLRFSLLSFMLMLVGHVMAEKVVTFTAGTDIGNNTTASGADQVSKDGVTISVTSGGFAAAQFRFAKGSTGTFSSTVGNITKIEFTCTASGDAQYGPGCFTDATSGSYSFSESTGVWTGNVAEFSLTASKAQVRATTIVVTIDGEPGGETPTPQPDDPNKAGSVNNPYTVAQAQELLATLAPNVKSEEVYAKGKISKIDEVETEQYGNATFYISDTGSEEGQLEVYRCVFLEKSKFTAADQIKVGDEVIICGQLVNYRSSKAAETDPVTPEFTQGCYIYSLNGKTKDESGEQPGPEPQITTISVAEALTTISALADGAKSENSFIVKGYIVGTPDFQRNADGKLYGNVNLDIADEKGGTTTLTVFRAKNFDNANFDEETISSLKEGDLIEVQGLLQKYVKDDVTTPELVSGYLISVNGKDAASVAAVKLDQDAAAPAYNLSGQQVSGSYRGLVIKNGRKFMVK